MRTQRILLGAVALSLLSASSVRAQAWDTPSFFPPRPGDDLGIYFVQPDGADWGLAGIWRQAGSLNLGVRGGLVQPEIGDIAIQVGGEVWGGLFEAGPAFPVDVAWTLGFGASFGDFTYARIPAGVSIGRELLLGGFTLTPYVHPRFALDIFAQDDRSDTDTSLVGDLGVDLALGGGLTVRLGATFGDLDAFGAGIAYRMARGVEVR